MFKSSFSILFLTLLFSWNISTSSSAEDPSHIPAQVFAKLANMSGLEMSPDGKYLAYISPSKGRKNIIIQNREANTAVFLPPVGEMEFFRIWWATNDRLLIGLETYETRRAVGLTNRETRLLAIDADIKNAAWVVRPTVEKGLGSNVNNKKHPPAQFQTKILSLLPDDKDNILLSLDGNFDSQYEVRKINIHTGKFKVSIEGQRGIQNWYTDRSDTISFGSGYVESKRYASLRMPNGKWRSIADLEAFDTYDFIEFTEDKSVVYVTGPNPLGTIGLYKMNLNSGEIIETVFEHNKVDVDYLLAHPRTGRTIGYAYTLDRTKFHYTDESFAKIQAIAKKALKVDEIQIIEKVEGKEQYILFSSDDREPGVYYWYDHTTKSLAFLSPRHPEVDPAKMAFVKAVEIPMQDGSTIPAYLTIPLGAEPKNLPTVILPHGGPLGIRDSADWDFTAQFLANRGYAVLQPNYRGSGGYGAKFQSMGWQQWGGLMQQDVTDASNWLIDEGIADKNRICIAGLSYGGYAAIMGVIQQPDLYKCSISVNGVTDLFALKNNNKRHYIGGRAMNKSMGLKDTKDQDISPSFLAKKVTAPVLVIASKDDTRLNYQWSEKFYKKIRKKNKTSKFVLIEDGGHNMVTENARLKMLVEMEKFLKEHIGD